MAEERSLDDRQGEASRALSLPENADSGRIEAANLDEAAIAAGDKRGAKVRAILKARLGDEVYNSWFKSIEFASFNGRELQLTVPVQFLKSWIQRNYNDVLLECCAAEFEGVEKVAINQRQPTATRKNVSALDRPQDRDQGGGDARRRMAGGIAATSGVPPPANGNWPDGSPLDPRHTFDSFVPGRANRLAHAGVMQAAESVLTSQRGVTPVVIHASVGMGKTHLLQATAWEVLRRAPNANVLYLTAERFRFKFIEALKSQEAAAAFKDRLRSVDMLLIDDFEHMQGERTELEFDHIINSLLDGGRQLIVACSRPPSQMERLNERMRSRLQRGVVAEIGTPDIPLRVQILEKRLAEKRLSDPSFDLPREVIELVANKLTENARDLEGAVNRLHFHWRTMRGHLPAEATETVIRDMLAGSEPRRIRIEDILRLIIRQFGVSKADILSQRRHRSVVWPRQIGMYLAKQLTARSLPEIGRRFGNRDHTTVLHAVRKIEGEIADDPRFATEIEEMKKQLVQQPPSQGPLQ